MTATPKAWNISVVQTLDLLDGSFKNFADGIAEGKYSFWLGSGISRDKFPMLDDLIAKVLEFLRTHIDKDNDACQYAIALTTALNYAGLSEEEKKQIDLDKPIFDWPIINSIQQRLTNQYETLLDIEVGDCNNDVLVWEGIDVVGTYGDDSVEPDAEHLCLAILIKEGVIFELASANWDGLIEKAMDSICDGASPLSVCVKSTDLQTAQNSPKLIKFHGCAIRAKEDEDTYRDYIVGRGSQIADWANSDRVKAIADHLKVAISERPTFMLGLSVQDFNIKGLFGSASATLSWDWPGDRPSYVFSEQEVTPGQSSLLQIVYDKEYQGQKRNEIKEGSQLQAFAKPLLLALVFYVLTEKAIRLAITLPTTANEPMASWIREGLLNLRNSVAETDNGDRLAMTENLIASVSRLRRLASIGNADNTDKSYEPLTVRPASEIVSNADTQSNGLPEAGCALAVLGKGIQNGYWSVEPSNEPIDQAPMAIVKSGGAEARLFVATTIKAEQNFFTSGLLRDDENAILIRSEQNYDRFQRSPAKAPGRTGKMQTRIVSITDLLAGGPTPDKLMEDFRAEAAI